MEAISDIYDLMKMQKPATNKATVYQEVTSQISATKSQNTEWLKSLYGDTQLIISQNMIPKSQVSFVFCWNTKETKLETKQRPRMNRTREGSLHGWPVRPVIS